MPTPRKPPGQRVRRNKDTPPEPKVVGALQAGPPLGRHPNGESWAPATKTWWESWRASWVMDSFSWGRLRQLALLVDVFHGNPTASAMGEIRRAQAEIERRAQPRSEMKRPVQPKPAAAGPSRSAKSMRAGVFEVIDGTG